MQRVTKAWVTDDLDQLPALYNPFISKNDSVEFLARLFIEHSRAGNYTQFHTGEGTLVGVVNEQLIDPTDSGFTNYVRQLIYQHSEGYLKMLGLLPEFDGFKNHIPAFDVSLAEEVAAILEKRLERERQIRAARIANSKSGTTKNRFIHAP
jgi:hypothetical protein